MTPGNIGRHADMVSAREILENLHQVLPQIDLTVTPLVNTQNLENTINAFMKSNTNQWEAENIRLPLIKDLLRELFPNNKAETVEYICQNLSR